MGWWRYRIPGLGEVDFRGYVDALYEGGFDGVLSRRARGPGLGRHAREGRAGPAHRPRHLRPLVVG